MTEPKFALSDEASEAMKKRKAELALQKANEMLKRSPAKKPEDKPKVTGKENQPGGKRLHPVAERIKALYDLDPSNVTEAQKKKYKDITGKELK